MKFVNKIHVIGMKCSKGVIEESGMAYDSTKVYVLQDMDTRKGDAKGQVSTEYSMGTSDEYSKFKHLPFPFDADGEFEIVSNGKTAKTLLIGLRPVVDQKVKA